MKLNLGQYFAADAWLRLWSFILVEILKLGLVKILKFKFSRNAEIWLRFWSWCLVDILEMKFDQNLCKNFDMTKEVILVSRTQPSSPLCLWQCLFLAPSGALIAIPTYYWPTNPPFQITLFLYKYMRLSLTEPQKLYQKQSLDSILWLHGYLMG